MSRDLNALILGAAISLFGSLALPAAATRQYRPHFVSQFGVNCCAVVGDQHTT